MPYLAEARIVCRMVGSGGNVVIGGPQADTRSHPFFDANSRNESLLTVFAKEVGQVPSNDIGACRQKAQQYVTGFLPAYSVNPDDGEAISIATGFAWRDGGWMPTGGAYVGYAFPLQHANEDVVQESDFKDTTGVNNQQLTLVWYVVIQPMA